MAEKDENEKKIDEIDINLENEQDNSTGIPIFNSFDDLNTFNQISGKRRCMLKILLLFSSIDSKEEILTLLRNYYEITRHNDIYELNYHITSLVLFRGYMYFTPENRLLFFSYNIKTDIEQYFLNLCIKKSKILTSLWLSNKVMKDLTQFIKFEYNSVFTSWSGKYNPTNKTQSIIRPSIKRSIDYRGNDTWDHIQESESYGYSIERVSIILIDKIYFQIYKKTSLIGLYYGNITQIFDIINFIYRNAEIYMKTIKTFEKKPIKSRFNPTLETKISTNLNIVFEQKIDEQIIKDIIHELAETKDLKITELFEYRFENSSISILKVINTNLGGSFRIIINAEMVHIFQIYNANYISSIPIIDVFDNCCLNNRIEVLG